MVVTFEFHLDTNFNKVKVLIIAYLDEMRVIHFLADSEYSLPLEVMSLTKFLDIQSCENSEGESGKDLRMFC